MHPATKNGYLLKKLSIVIRIDSRSILPVGSSGIEVKGAVDDARTGEQRMV